MDSDRKKIDSVIHMIIKGERNISPETDLFEDLGFSSLQVVELIASLEEEFDIFIPMNEIQHIRTAGDIYRDIEILLKKAIK